MKNNSEPLERAFLQLVLERLQRRGINFSEFAVLVWPDVPKKTAVGKFRELREPSTRTGKYQNLSLGAASRMAEALGEELSYLLAVAHEDVRRQSKECQS